MARRNINRRRGRQRRGRRNTAQFGGMSQVANAVIKGTIKYGESINLNFADFKDLPQDSQLFPRNIQISIVSMNGPTYISLSQWDGGDANSYFRVANRLITTKQVARFNLRWPRNPFEINKCSSLQILVQIQHCAGGDVYGDEKPLLFYMANLWTLEAADALSPTVDPPHQNIKHSSTPSTSMEHI